MATLDVFKGDGFSMAEMTAAIEDVPYTPMRATQLNLLSDRPISSKVSLVEKRGNQLAIVPMKSRQDTGTKPPAERRSLRMFEVPHFPQEDFIYPDDLIGLRKMGSDSDTEGVNDLVARKLATMRANLGLTHEFQIVKALQGLLVDETNTTVTSFLTEFGVGRPAVDFTLGTTATLIRALCLTVRDLIEEALQAAAYDHIHALCGKAFFRRFIEHPEVKYAYQYYQEGMMLRNDPRAGFEYGDIVWEEYRNPSGMAPFVPTNEAVIFPAPAQETDELYTRSIAPAPLISAVGTLGQLLYSSSYVDPEDKFVKLTAQTNTIVIPTRPASLVQGTTSN